MITKFYRIECDVVGCSESESVESTDAAEAPKGWIVFDRDEAAAFPVPRRVICGKHGIVFKPISTERP